MGDIIMNNLTELNNAITALNDLWPLLDSDDRQRDEIIEYRDQLDAQASELAHKILNEGAPMLNDAIEKLNLVTDAAIEAKESIDDDTRRINKVGNTIDKSVSAIEKVAAFVATL
jgi:ABC-type transporter Mla subunit MlaD